MATVVLGVLLLVLCGRMVAVGDEIRLRREKKHELVFPAMVLLTTLAFQLGAMFFYLQRYRRCDSMTGFAVFLLVSGVAGFIVAMFISPLSPLLRLDDYDTDAEEEHHDARRRCGHAS